MAEYTPEDAEVVRRRACQETWVRIAEALGRPSGSACRSQYEIRSLNNRECIANLSVASSKTWKDKMSSERKTKTEWHRVTVFNDRIVDFVKKFVRKGSLVYLEGAIATRKWTDNSGADRYSTEIVLQKFRGELTLLNRVDDGGDAHEPVDAALGDSIPY
jgi:single-strand DNA-binding protein